MILAEGTSIFPHLNASLNALAAVLLCVGIVLIKKRHEVAHKWVMISCFGVSVLFLCSYLYYHLIVMQGSKEFPRATHPTAYLVYLPILGTHIILAATVPFLALATIVLGLRDRREWHRRFAKWTFPIWLYVSITGVIVYAMLYWMFPGAEGGSS